MRSWLCRIGSKNFVLANTLGPPAHSSHLYGPNFLCAEVDWSRPTTKLGFHGAAPTGQRYGVRLAMATNLTSVITLANELRAALLEKGVIKRREANRETLSNTKPFLTMAYV